MLALLPLVLASSPKHWVEFSFRDAGAKTVEIAGDFDAWTKPYEMHRKGDRWIKSFDLPDDARIEYKLVVDGRWILDPADPEKCDNGVGGENSVWVGPTYRFSADDTPPAHPLTRSEIPVGGRPIIVFAPQDSKSLPLLIYGDGPNYESFGKIQNVVENLVEQGKIRPVVIVLIPPIDRMKEYGPEWKVYGQYVFDQVLPAVRSATGASESKEDVYMGGSSLGGLISLRLAEEFPNQLAGGIQCQSAAIQWSPMHLHYNEAADQGKLVKIARSTRIWLDWGTFEDGLTPANVELTKTLKSMHRPFAFKTTDDGHTWTAWRNRMEAGLVYILGLSAR